MNKDAKIGLFAVLILVVLVAVMWAKLAGNRDEAAPVGDPAVTDVAANDSGTQGSETLIVRNPVNPADTPPADGYRPGDVPFRNTGRDAGLPPANTNVGDTSGDPLTGNTTNTSDTSGLTPPAPADLKELFLGMDKAPIGPDPLNAVDVTPAAVSDGSKEHMVAKGESLAVIARKYGTTWQEIAEANKATLPHPAKLKIGQKLTIPQAAPKTEPAKTDAVQGTVKSDESKTSPPAAGKTYTVKRGDTLISISRAAYGKAGLWKAILNANKDKLPSAEKLRPGMVLVLPEKP